MHANLDPRTPSRHHVDKEGHSRRKAHPFFLESRSSLGTASSLAAMMKSFSVSPLRECVHSSTLSRFQFCTRSALLQAYTELGPNVRSRGSRRTVLLRTTEWQGFPFHNTAARLGLASLSAGTAFAKEPRMRPRFCLVQLHTLLDSYICVASAQHACASLLAFLYILVFGLACLFGIKSIFHRIVFAGDASQLICTANNLAGGACHNFVSQVRATCLGNITLESMLGLTRRSLPAYLGQGLQIRDLMFSG